jgi:hypothetical protein
MPHDWIIKPRSTILARCEGSRAFFYQAWQGEALFANSSDTEWAFARAKKAGKQAAGLIGKLPWSWRFPATTARRRPLMWAKMSVTLFQKISHLPDLH